MIILTTPASIPVHKPAQPNPHLEFQARNEIQKQVIRSRIGHSNFLQDLR